VRVHETKGNWPSDEELTKMVALNPVTKVAKLIGVSDSAVKKRCRKRGIPTRKRGYWAKLRK